MTCLTVWSYLSYGFLLHSIDLLVYSKIRNYKSIKLTVTTHFVVANLFNSKRSVLVSLSYSMKLYLWI